MTETVSKIVEAEVKAASCGSKTRLHQTSASMLWQICEDAGNFVFIKNNGVTPLFLMRTELLALSCRVIAALTLSLGVNRPLQVVTRRPQLIQAEKKSKF